MQEYDFKNRIIYYSSNICLLKEDYLIYKEDNHYGKTESFGYGSFTN